MTGLQRIGLSDLFAILRIVLIASACIPRTASAQAPRLFPFEISITGDDINHFVDRLGKGIVYIVDEFKRNNKEKLSEALPLLIKDLNTLSAQKELLAKTR
jgi:hypothetical protein